MLQFLKRLASSVPAATAGRVRLFIDSVDGLPKVKDEAGTVTSLRGPTGAAATIAVGTVSTGAPGSSVVVTNAGTSSAAVFDITIPRGATGAAGAGSGDVTASGSVADGHVAVFDGTTGDIIKDGGALGTAAFTASSAYATSGHNHDTAYSALGHNHDTAYSSITHNHNTDYQPIDPQLTALAAMTPAANKLQYWTGLDTVALTDLSSFARTLLDDADAATARATLGVSVADPGMVLLATLTPTAAATVDALTVFSSTYDDYVITAEGLAPSSNDQLAFRFAASGAADSSSSYYQSASESNTVVTGAATSGLLSQGTQTSSSGAGINFVSHILNANSATGIKSAHGSAANQGSTGVVLSGVHVGYTAANAITGIRFFWNSGNNFAAQGVIRIYGIKK